MGAEENGSGPADSSSDLHRQLERSFAAWQEASRGKGRNADAAHDYFYEALHRNRPSASSPLKATAAFFRRLSDLWRINRLRAKCLEVSAAVQQRARREPYASDPAEIYLAREETEAMVKLISGLPITERAAFLLHYWLEVDCRLTAIFLFGANGPNEIAAVHRARYAAKSKIDVQVHRCLGLEVGERIQLDSESLARLFGTLADDLGFRAAEGGAQQ